MQEKIQTAPTAKTSIPAVPHPISAKSIVINRTQNEVEVTSSPSNASTPVPATPSSVAPNSAQSHHIKSAMSLVDWRGSINTFNGFTGTKPTQELKDASWGDIKTVLVPEEPATLIDKSKGLFFVPCHLKEAPLVGNTLEAATRSGLPTTGKMRSKQHVTEAMMLVMDVDGLSDYDFKAGLAKIIGDGVTVLYYSTYSHGSTEKPGMRARLVILVDRPLNIEEYFAAWHGADQHYWGGKAGQADASGANMYQQQGTWCCHPDRLDNAKAKEIKQGVASADALIALGRIAKPACAAQLASPVKSAKELRISLSLNQSSSASAGDDYPASDANKVAQLCQQIRVFRETKGADQSEPSWFNALGVVAHCANGADLCQQWSSGHADYNERKTSQKIAYRLKTPPTTCAQFQKTTPAECQGCTQECNSPITLGWEKQVQEQFEVVAITPTIEQAQAVTAQGVSEKVTPVAGKLADQASDDAVIASLASLNPLDYDRVRNEKAKEMGVLTKTLDGMVKNSRKADVEGGRLPFPEIEPFPESIEPALVFDEVAETIKRHVVMDDVQADTAALWCVHTYLIGEFDTSPLAIVNAPEKECAKTLLQTVLSRMCYRPLPAANASSSALFRAVELWRPTIFFDEADTFFRDKPELHGMVNAGYKNGGFVLRSESVGDTFEPRMFSVYSAKSIAGIALEKHLPESTMSRGIVFNLRRKMPHEKVSRLRYTDPAHFDLIASKLARFAADYSKQIRLARPFLPRELGDRAQDNWEPLLAIAQCAGPVWVKRATEAALVLSRKNEESVSTGNELLADIQSVFESKAVDRIRTADLIAALIADDEKPWATYNRGKPFTPRQLGKQLATYNIASKTVRFGPATPKGFELAQFQDAFARYLSQTPPVTQQRNETPEPSNGMASGDADETQQVQPESETPKIMPTLDCGGVAAVSAPQAGDAGEPSQRAPEDAF